MSALYAYSQHGDPYVRSLVTHLLNQVGKLTLAQFPVRHRSQYLISFKWRGKTRESFSCAVTSGRQKVETFEIMSEKNLEVLSCMSVEELKPATFARWC